MKLLFLLLRSESCFQKSKIDISREALCFQMVSVFFMFYFNNLPFPIAGFQSADSVVDQNSPALNLVLCILFGGFMGLLDDWMDLRWRYKVFLPIFAVWPLGVLRR